MAAPAQRLYDHEEEEEEGLEPGRNGNGLSPNGHGGGKNGECPVRCPLGSGKPAQRLSLGSTHAGAGDAAVVVGDKELRELMPLAEAVSSEDLLQLRVQQDLWRSQRFLGQEEEVEEQGAAAGPGTSVSESVEDYLSGRAALPTSVTGAAAAPAPAGNGAAGANGSTVGGLPSCRSCCCCCFIPPVCSSPRPLTCACSRPSHACGC